MPRTAPWARSSICGGGDDMLREEINIRDPFILNDGGVYYLYGSTDPHIWGGACSSFSVYRSRDLERFEGPFEVFRRPEDFWSEEQFWAPKYTVTGIAITCSRLFGERRAGGARYSFPIRRWGRSRPSANPFRRRDGTAWTRRCSWKTAFLIPLSAANGCRSKTERSSSPR